MPAEHATGTLGILGSSALDRDTLVGAGNFGWYVQSGAVTFNATLTFNVAAVTAGDYVVNGTIGAAYAGGTVTLTTQDATNPRVDIIVITAAGAVSAVAGTPRGAGTLYAAPTSGASPTSSFATTGPVPPTPSSSQLEIARIYVPASGTALTGANITDRRLNLPTIIRNYKTATQVFTTNTTYADVAGAFGAAFSFWAVASGVYEVEYWIPLSFGGTGGAKFQITGPAAPTGVDITGIRTSTSTVAVGVSYTRALTPVTAFSSDVATFASAANGASDTAYPNNDNALIHIRARITNGSTAGAVTLQAAQNNANSTTTLGIGSFMRAERIA